MHQSDCSPSKKLRIAQSPKFQPSITPTLLIDQQRINADLVIEIYKLLSKFLGPDFAARPKAADTDTDADTENPFQLSISFPQHVNATMALVKVAAAALSKGTDAPGSNCINVGEHKGCPTPIDLSTSATVSSALAMGMQTQAKDAFIKAVKCGDLATVRLFLAAGAGPATKNSAGMSAIHTAVVEDNEVVLEAMLDSTDSEAADVDIYAGGDSWTGLTPLQAASLLGKEMTAKILLQRDADVEVLGPRNHRALHMAAMCGHAKIVRLLVDHDANEFSTNEDGETALMLAAFQDRPEVCRIPLETSDVDTVALRCSRNYLDVTEVLLSFGAKLQKNADGLEDRFSKSVAQIKSAKNHFGSSGTNPTRKYSLKQPDMADTALKSYSFEEVHKHRTASDCWVILYGKVYDLTDFLPEHPGGQKVILKEAGHDATEAFQQFHPKDILERLLPESALIGMVDPSSVPVRKATAPTTPAAPAAAAPAAAAPKSVAKAGGSGPVVKPPLSAMLNFFDFEAVARKVLKPEAWAYYSSGADDEITLRENRAAFHRVSLRPRVMVNVKEVDTSTTMLGTHVTLPIYITSCALGRLGHPDGELNLVRAARTRGIVQLMPTLASCSLDEMIDAASEGQVQWLQLYVNSDRKVAEKIIRHAEKRGVKALFVTVDAPQVSLGEDYSFQFLAYILLDRPCVQFLTIQFSASPQLGRREKDMRIKFVDNAPDVQDESTVDRSQGAARAISSFIDASLSWSDLPWLLSVTSLPVLLKGVQRGEDAVMAARYGCAGIVVSNHGGRQLDTSRSGIEVLVEVVKALEACPGIRRVRPPAPSPARHPDGIPRLPTAPVPFSPAVNPPTSGFEVLPEAFLVPPSATLAPYYPLHPRDSHRPAARSPHRFEIYVDGGFRRATDIVKALALGATGVGIGRPTLYAMSAYGQQGVERLLDIVRDELVMTMRLMGARTIAEIQGDMVVAGSLGLHVGDGALRDHLTEAVYEPLRPVGFGTSKL
ncbi:hypothetical protein HDU96_009492 [Phlyctochytrium bullatum]|nr:hypothetical protein HDU96_009492 [Phlyctochytrium bullatum]